MRETGSNNHRSGRAQYAITLVHGTFARHAPWTQPDSSLCRTLRALLAPAELIITPYQWSGWNSPWSRRKAAHGLRAELARQKETYPEAQLYVIGHSHGGGVALQAVRDLWHRIGGVATLATPFIHMRTRTQAPFDYPGMLLWLCFLPIMIPVVGTVWMASAGFDHTYYLHYGVVAVLAVLALATARFLSAAILRLADHTCATMPCDAPDEANLLIVRTSGDEASALLAGSQLLSWFVSRLWSRVGKGLRPLFWLLRMLERGGQVVPALVIPLVLVFILDYVVATVIADVMAGMFGAGRDPWAAYPLPVRFVMDALKPFTTPGHSLGEMAGTILAVVVVFCAVAASLAIVIFVPVLLLVSLALLPFGAASALAALRVELSVEPVPPGVWAIHQFRQRGRREEDALQLAHSAAYEDPRVFTLLASWILRGKTRNERNIGPERTEAENA